MEIFIDMDGVLCDFDTQFSSLKGIPRSKVKGYKSPDMWKIIERAGEEYWSQMGWNPGGRELWNFLRNFKPIILSSPMRHDSCTTGKLKWVAENLGKVPVILESKKYIYSKPGAILIDDLEKNIGPWRDNGGIGILHDETNIPGTIEKVRRALNEKAASVLIDKVASALENKGLLKEAYELDIVSNTLEAFEKYKSRPVVIDPYDSIVQQAVRALGPALKDIDVIKLETSCPGDRLAWVSNQDLIKGKPGMQRVIHLCLNKIKDNFKKKYNNSFTMNDPEEQKQMQKVIVQFLKDVVLPHEAEHVHQEMEHGGDFGSGAEQKAERAENWKAVEDMGYKRK